MIEKIKVGIMGYGNLGRGVELALKKTSDMELKCIFTRRAPETLKPLTEGINVYKAEDALKYKNEIDVLILCGGSATDLPIQGPEFASAFNTVDSFDTHAKIPEKRQDDLHDHKSGRRHLSAYRDTGRRHSQRIRE